MKQQPSRANAAAQEGPGRGVDELPLPRLEPDPSLVLLARPVLREQAREVAAVDPQDDGRAAVGQHPAGAVGREDASQQRLALADDARVARVERQSQALGAGERRDVTVAEVEAEQLGVVRGGEGDPRAAAPAARAGAARRVGRRPASPVAHRRARDPEPARHLAIVLAARRRDRVRPGERLLSTRTYVRTEGGWRGCGRTGC